MRETDPITPDTLRDRIARMTALAEAFEADAEHFAQRAAEAYEQQKRGDGMREITVHYLNSRDDLRRAAKTNREDAAISAQLLAALHPKEPDDVAE